MSQAHRPQWNPTQGRESKAGSQQISKFGLASYTKLKFRQPGQTSTGDVARRDLRAELAAAERAANEKKRKAAGLPAVEEVSSSRRIEAAGSASVDGEDEEDEETRKRRKVLEEAAELDKDDSDDDEAPRGGKGKEKATNGAAANDNDDDEEEDDDDDDSDSDDEDETAALMAELAKIKQERAEEKAAQARPLEAEASAAKARDRDAEIATGNPLLNLQAALGQTPGTPASTAGSTATFAVKRRWDDDLIFKNQASGVNDKPKKEFVNDLLRSDFHRKFMLKYIK